VTTSAQGVTAEVFNGSYDNTDIALKIMQAMGLEPTVRYTAQTEEKALVAQQ
jgi:alkaline phosphatase